MTQAPTPSHQPLMFDGKAARDFFVALQVDPTTVHYRGIHWDKNLEPRSARGVHVAPSAEPQQQRLEALQRQGYRLYWLPNGGPKDEHITTCRFLFVEWDDNTLEWQLQAWRQCGLPEPTVMLSTGGKSIHCYWRLSEPIDANQWRALIARLIHHCKSDPSCCNPSRLMRLAGGSYIYKTGDVDAAGHDVAGTCAPLGASVVTASGLSYDALEFDAILPHVPAPEPAAPLLRVTIPPPAPGQTRTASDPRSFAELERLVAAYPEIRKDNDQYHEAVQFIFGLCMAAEEAGHSRAEAVAMASRYHPGAADTFADALTAKINRSQGGSFVKMCRSAGVDVKRHDIVRSRREPPPNWDPGEPPDHPPDSDDDEDRDAVAAAAADLLAAAREPLTLTDVLPDGLALPLIERAKAFPCDPMAFLLPLLCSAASVVGNRMQVEVKRTHREPFVLWGANIMPASSMKSPISGVMTKALGMWQVDLKKAAKKAKTEWMNERNRIVLLADKEALKQWEAENPPPPSCRELFIVDATLEKVGMMLDNEETPGMVAYHDELSMWFAQLKRGKEAMDQRSNWLSMWNGGLLKVDRVGRESIYVAHTAQSIFGNATVDGLAGIRGSSKASNGNQDADGMWARFLLWQPDDVPYVPNDLDHDVTELLCNLFRHQLDAKVAALGATADAPAMVPLSPGARDAWGKHAEAWGREARESTAERGQWIGKLRGHAVRIAGVLHVLDAAIKDLPLTGAISPDTMARALRLCHALLDQYDLICPKVGGDTGALDPAVAKLLAHGIDWRRANHAAPVPGHHVRKVWNLPERGATATAANAWLLEQVGTDRAGALGWVEVLRQGVRWHPPV